MFDKLIYIIPFVTLLFFAFYIFYKGSTVQSCLLFIIYLLPLMDLRITREVDGGFRVFHVICIYSFIFLFKDFTTINLKSKNGFYFLLFILLIIIILIGGLASEFPNTIYLRLFKFLPIFIYGRLFLTECFKNPSFYYKAIKALKVTYIIALIFLGLQMIIGLNFTMYPNLAGNTIDSEYNLVRYPSYFFDSQGSGQYFAMGIFFFLYIEKGESNRTIILNHLIFLTGILAIYLAGSRSAIGGFAIALTFVFIVAGKVYRIYGSILCVLGFLILSSVNLNIGVFKRADNLSEDYKFRHSIWAKAYEISNEHPYLGIGYGNYQDYTMRHVQDQYLIIGDNELIYFDQPENGYLKILVEVGFIGFGIFVLFIIVPIFKGLILFMKNIYDNQVIFLIGSVISWLIAFNTVNSFNDSRLLIMVTSLIILIISCPTKNTVDLETKLTNKNL